MSDEIQQKQPWQQRFQNDKKALLQLNEAVKAYDETSPNIIKKVFYRGSSSLISWLGKY